ncbi:hypothetical protein [Olivibacter sp. EAT-5]
MISKTFMRDHPKCGKPTNFKEKILSGQKIHTIRLGIGWKKITGEVNAGIAVLSVREWSGEPYKSKQVEIVQFEKAGWQSLEITEPRLPKLFIDGCDYGISHIDTIAHNDGLDKYDFYDWFDFPSPFIGGIIHFTDFRY